MKKNQQQKKLKNKKQNETKRKNRRNICTIHTKKQLMLDFSASYEAFHL